MKKKNTAFNIKEYLSGLSPDTKSLDLSHKNIQGTHDIGCLKKYLDKNNSVTDINIPYNKIGDTGVAILSLFLQQKTCKLEKLNFSNIDMGACGMNSFIKSLKQNSSITDLNISGNKILDDGMYLLTTYLTDNKSLTSLNISNIHVGTETMKSFYKILWQNQTIKSLYLYGILLKEEIIENNIGPGIKNIAKLLQKNTSITYLDLSQNNLRDKEVMYLTPYLKNNASLTYLNLSGNSIEDQGKSHLSEKLQDKTPLTIYLDGSKIIGDICDSEETIE